jgi:small-conductance mechanosensitive channel
MEPEPMIFFEGYGESSVDLRLGVWVVQEKVLELKNSLLEEIKARFDAEGIEIPFPHRTFYPGLGAGPLEVRLLGRDAEEEGGEGESREGESDRSPSADEKR